MQQRSIPEAIVIGGLLGGALDLLFAVSFAASNGVAPTHVFQAIANGILGKAAFVGGDGASAFDIACHFGLSVLWAALCAAIAWWIPVLARRPLLAGIGFGLVVFLCMRLVVLPLSAFPNPVTFQPLATVLDLLSHMFLFALPIAIVVGRAIRARRPDNLARGPR
jgi:hypothetical protein